MNGRPHKESHLPFPHSAHQLPYFPRCTGSMDSCRVVRALSPVATSVYFGVHCFCVDDPALNTLLCPLLLRYFIVLHNLPCLKTIQHSEAVRDRRLACFHRGLHWELYAVLFVSVSNRNKRAIRFAKNGGRQGETKERHNKAQISFLITHQLASALSLMSISLRNGSTRSTHTRQDEAQASNEALFETNKWKHSFLMSGIPLLHALELHNTRAECGYTDCYPCNIKALE